jgi:hypothetical protein
LKVKIPVHSSAVSTPSSFHGNVAGEWPADRNDAANAAVTIPLFLTIPPNAPNEAQLVHNYRVQSAGTATTSEPISSGNRERFLGNIFSGRDMQVAASGAGGNPLALTCVLPHREYFTAIIKE